MNISSVLVNARPERIDEVRGGLLALDGVEIHAATEEGRMIVTIEDESEQAVISTFQAIHHQPGVLSASMVYHQYESDPDEEA